MAQVRAEIKRGILRSLFRQAQRASIALATALDAYQDQCFSSIKTGRITISSAGAGHNVTFATPAIGLPFQQDEIFALTEEFQAVYTDSQAFLVSSGNSTPTDQQIFDVMEADDRLQAATTVIQDHTFIRYPSR